MSTKYYILSFALTVIANTTKTDSIQTIDVLNNSAQILHLTANNTDRSLSLNHAVPAFAKSLVLVQVTQLHSLQDMLFEAILNDSAHEVRQAIKAGANVNLEKEGKRPLVWAISFRRTNAVRCLLEHGAI